MLGLGINIKLKKRGTSSGAAASPYQSWSGFPDTPELTADWPYQAIGYFDESTYRLLLSKHPIYNISGTQYGSAESQSWKPDGGTWIFSVAGAANFANRIQEANNDIYTDATLTVVDFAKTT